LRSLAALQRRHARGDGDSRARDGGGRVPGISPARLDGADVMDLAPTVHALLGVPVPARMKGRPLAPVSAHARGATPAC
jgi:arylsulfatase A-like enzyme